MIMQYRQYCVVVARSCIGCSCLIECCLKWSLLPFESEGQDGSLFLFPGAQVGFYFLVWGFWSGLLVYSLNGSTPVELIQARLASMQPDFSFSSAVDDVHVFHLLKWMQLLQRPGS